MKKPSALSRRGLPAIQGGEPGGVAFLPWFVNLPLKQTLKAACVHNLGEGRHEVVNKLLFVSAFRIDFGLRAKLRV